MRREPPDILITTPESLYLIITSGAREILGGVEAVIVDEIHAVAPSKRGSHLALTLERFADGEPPPAPPDYAAGHGLSATQRPLERIGQFLVGSKRSTAIADVPESRRSSIWRSSSPSRTWPSRAPLIEKRRGGGDSGKTPAAGLDYPEGPGADRGLAGPGAEAPLDLAGDLS